MANTISSTSSLGHSSPSEWRAACRHVRECPCLHRSSAPRPNRLRSRPHDSESPSTQHFVMARKQERRNNEGTRRAQRQQQAICTPAFEIEEHGSAGSRWYGALSLIKAERTAINWATARLTRFLLTRSVCPLSRLARNRPIHGQEAVTTAQIQRGQVAHLSGLIFRSEVAS